MPVNTQMEKKTVVIQDERIADITETFEYIIDSLALIPLCSHKFEVGL